MSYTAQRHNSKSSLLYRAKNQEANQEIKGAHNEPPYTKEYFAAFAAQPWWKSRRSDGVELPFLDVKESLQDAIEAYVGHDEQSPNWTDAGSITIGYAYGANQNNFLIWQGSQYWNINTVILPQAHVWPSDAPWDMKPND